MPAPGLVLWHTVHITFFPFVNQIARDEILDLYQNLKSACGGSDAGIISLIAHSNLDDRLGVHLGVVAIFDDMEARKCFRQHPAHCKLKSKLNKIAERGTFNFYAPLVLP